MGKIGDLIVRLSLKKEDYEKGLKEVQRSTKKAGGIFSHMEGVGVQAWEMICDAALKAAKQILVATNKVSDEWELFCAKGKAAWDSFTKNIANNATWKTAITGLITSINWKDLFSSIGKETNAAEILFAAKDEDTEIANSIKLERARIAEQLEQLRIDMRDATKTYAEKAAAAKEYERLVLPIYDKEIERVQRLKNAQYEAFVTKSNWEGNGKVKANQKIWEEMLVAYGDQSKIAALGGKTFFDAIKGGTDNQALLKYAADRFGLGSTNVAKYWLDNFYNHYETERNGEEVQALVDSILAVYAAEAARTSELRTVKTAYNNAVAGMEREKEEARAELEAEKQEFNELLDDIYNDFYNSLDDIIYEPIEIEIEPIHFDFTETEKQIDQFLAEWRKDQEEIEMLNSMFENSMVSSISNGMQAFTDMLMGVDGADASKVFAALMDPFAKTMVQLGEILLAEGLAIEVFKSSLSSLNGTAAIAAGIGLIALGSALGSAIQALGSSSMTSASSASAAESSSGGLETYDQEITVYVTGEISGDKIILSGQKTLNKWKR